MLPVLTSLSLTDHAPCSCTFPPAAWSRVNARRLTSAFTHTHKHIYICSRFTIDTRHSPWLLAIIARHANPAGSYRHWPVNSILETPARRHKLGVREGHSSVGFVVHCPRSISSFASQSLKSYFGPNCHKHLFTYCWIWKSVVHMAKFIWIVTYSRKVLVELVDANVESIRDIMPELGDPSNLKRVNVTTRWI